MRYLILLAIPLLICGCGKQEADADSKKEQPGAIEQARDRATGKTAVKTHEQAKSALNDVKAATDSRAKDLENFKK